jgi:hypothetical protein
MLFFSSAHGKNRDGPGGERSNQKRLCEYDCEYADRSFPQKAINIA